MTLSLPDPDLRKRRTALILAPFGVKANARVAGEDSEVRNLRATPKPPDGRARHPYLPCHFRTSALPSDEAGQSARLPVNLGLIPSIPSLPAATFRTIEPPLSISQNLARRRRPDAAWQGPRKSAHPPRPTALRWIGAAHATVSAWCSSGTVQPVTTGGDHGLQQPSED